MEKFALLNLLKALETLAPQTTADSADGAPPSTAPQSEAQQAKPEGAYAYPNVMASVLERHEQISNRLKNKK